MREEALERGKLPKPIRVSIEKEVERKNLPQNPSSPEVLKYPFDSMTKPVRIDSSVSSQIVGLQFSAGTLADTLSFPPDTIGDLGPTQFIMAVNGRIRSFNKQTGVADGIPNADMDVSFSSVRGGHFTTDPRIRYDRLTQRWFVII